MALFKDQLGRTIEISENPARIISLVPSQTELLYDLGLEESVSGITKFCVHPQSWFREKPRIGGTKQLAIDRIRSLHPDLILANKEENLQEEIALLSEDFNVWISDVKNLQDATEMIRMIGSITNTSHQAEKIISRIAENFLALQTHISSTKPRTCYLIWKDPYMTVGGDTFIHDMLNRSGFENVFGHRLRYPQITMDELRGSGCELLLLSSEPYPFQKKHREDLQARLPGVKILLADGEYFSWYGSRLINAPAYFLQVREQLEGLSVF